MFGQRAHYMRGLHGGSYPRFHRNAARVDAWPPNGRPPGTDLDFMRLQLLDAWDIQYGILNPLAGAGGQLNMEYGAQLARAVKRLPGRRNGSNPSRGCALRFWSTMKMGNWLRRRFTAAATTPASYRFSPSSAPMSLSASANTGRCTKPPLNTTCRSASTLAARAATRSQPAAGRHTTLKITAACLRPTRPISPASSAKAYSSTSRSFVSSLSKAALPGPPPSPGAWTGAGNASKPKCPFLKKAPSEYILEHFWFTTPTYGRAPAAASL